MVTNPVIRTRRKRVVIVSLVVFAAGCTALLLALEYRPGWYAPLPLTETQLQQGRIEAMRVVDRVGDQLVDRKPFEIALSDDQVNIWLSGLAQIWPDAARQIPSEVVEPFVAFEAASLRIAARLESNGWRAIVSSDCGLRLSPDKKHLVVQLTSARCGAVALPRFILGPLLKPYLRAGSMRGYTMDQLFHGLEFENRFVWPNGKRPFRIGELTVESGRIRLRIEPL